MDINESLQPPSTSMAPAKVPAPNSSRTGHVKSKVRYVRPSLSDEIKSSYNSIMDQNVNEAIEIESDAKVTTKKKKKRTVRRANGSKECPYCDMTFSNKEHLKNHIRTHTGEKPFACQYCSDRFSMKSTLIQHIRTHTGERPFACSFCSDCFTTKSILTAHLRTHTGEKPYQCDI